MVRYVVELENNHHYIVVDTVTGSSYFTPAQDDANALANMLNRYEDKLVRQKKKVKKYKDLVGRDKTNNVYVKKRKGECGECKYAHITFLTTDDDIYCSKFDDTFKVSHSCNSFVKEL